jgi:hypothetical protein
VTRVTESETESRSDSQTEESQVKRLKTIAAILAVALVLAIAVAAWLFVQKGDAEDKADTAEAQLSDLDEADLAARALLHDMTTYDYQHADEMYDWLDQLGNSDVKKQTVSNAKRFEKVVRITKASSEGEVQESASRLGPDDSVVVILFVHQTITEDRSKSTKTEDQWATFTMVPGDTQSGWLAQDVQLSGIPNPDGTVTQQ